MSVRLEVNNADFLATHLRAEELDFYLADVRNVVAAPDLHISRVANLPGGFYVRAGHPLLSLERVTGAALLPYGIASVRLPEAVRTGLAPPMGLEAGKRVPLALECDDLSLLKALALGSDTVIGSTDVGTVQDVQAGQLVRLEVVDIPPMFSDMAIVSLKGRSYSLMAQFAVDFIVRQAQEMSPPGA